MAHSPTEKISHFVDHCLKPTVPNIRSYVKDTTHFLQILENVGQDPEGARLVCLDITSLYTNIPNKEGLEAAEVTLRA